MSTTSTASALQYPSGATVVLGPDASRDEWHAVRKSGIGGSDIAAICGLNPWTSPLEIWLKKTGQTVPPRDDVVLNEAALMGHALEPVTATRFTAITGLIANENPGTLRMPEIPWALVNLDRTTEEDGLPGVVELKSRSSYALNDWLEEPPVDVQVQTQWQMLVTGWSFGYTAALIGGQRTIVHRIERDEKLIDDLLAIGAEFWGWVETGTQPPLDGSHATGDLLDRIHAKPTRKDVIADAAEVEKWLAVRRTAHEQMAAAEAAATEADNHLKALAGDGTDVYIRGELAYTWRPRLGQISWKAAALELDPDLDPEPYRGEDTRVLNIVMENQ